MEPQESEMMIQPALMQKITKDDATKFVEFVRSFDELAIAQPAALDMPESSWKAYIDFEIGKGEYEKARALYERLLDRTKDLKVWISYAKFEADAMEDCSSLGLPEEELLTVVNEKKNLCVKRTRSLFERALSHYFRVAAPELKEEKAMLLEEWLNLEKEFGELGDVASVQSKMPKKLKRRRPIVTEDGPAGFEEYFEYWFPDERYSLNLDLMKAAYKWYKEL